MANNRINLLEGRVGPTLLRLAGPMTLGFVAIVLFNVVDTFWVGRLGARELAAMSFTFPVVFFLMSVAIGMGIGVTAVVSRLIGERDDGRVCRVTTDGLFLANALVVVFAFGGLATIRPLFAALGLGLMGAGFIFGFPLTVIGLIMLFVSAFGWSFAKYE